jgi:hypothetical protein
MTIYCSKKLETYLGDVSPLNPQLNESTLGDWNGHLFTVNRKKCLILTNNKTWYSVIVLDVTKKDNKIFRQNFKVRLLEQLRFDLKINVEQSEKIQETLKDIVFSKSNNDKSTMGIINHHVQHLKWAGQRDGGIEYSDMVFENSVLNGTPMGKKFKFPKETMAEILATAAKQP